MTTAELQKIILYVDPLKLKAARLNAGYEHIARVAPLVDTTRQKLWSYEATGKNSHSAPPDILARLCTLYGCDIRTLTTNEPVCRTDPSE